MAYITHQEANAWADGSKLRLTSLDSELESSVASQVLGRVSQVYDVSSWVADVSVTPTLVKKIIAMGYMAAYYQRVYSEDTDLSNYGIMLQDRVDNLIDGIVAGDLTLTDGTVVDSSVAVGDTALFYPTDASSALVPTMDDSSLGGAKFTMGQIW